MPLKSILQFSPDAIGGLQLITRKPHLYTLLRHNGPAGLFYYLFGSRTTWRTQAHVLGTVNDHVALDFKKSVQDECAMVSVAAAIVAQITISAYGLQSMSQTHWIARAFFVFALVAALMSVYYSTTLHRIMGRLLEGPEVRAWIRGFPRLTATKPSYKIEKSTIIFKSDPQNLENWDCNTERSMRLNLEAGSFRPAYYSVITISAPQILLSSSLFSLLTGIGVYLGFMWTNHIDDGQGRFDNRNIWIVYLVTAVVTILVYSTSRLITERDLEDEDGIVHHYCGLWLASEAGAEAQRLLQLKRRQGERPFSPKVVPKSPRESSPHVDGIAQV